MAGGVSMLLDKKMVYPPEWALQKKVWLSMPHNVEDWGQEGLGQIQEFYYELIDIILKYQDVHILVKDSDAMSKHSFKIKDMAAERDYNANLVAIETNDIWIRDYGPFFMKAGSATVMVDFEFNAYGGKFQYNLDNLATMNMTRVTKYERISCSDMVLEGGAIETNGEDVMLTTKTVLQNKNRNPHLLKADVERNLSKMFKVKHILWLPRGIEGDHTDGHIDDFARFYAKDKLFFCEAIKDDSNHEHLELSYNALAAWKHPQEGYKLKIKRLPMPVAKVKDGVRLASSYANFIYLNNAIVVPTFNCPQDAQALAIFKEEFPDRTIESIDCSLLIEEGGGLHCMTKQEPA